MNEHVPPTDDAHEFAVERVFQGMLGRSAAMNVVFEKIARYAGAEAPVLVTGETGTGKELIARAIHRLSPRRRNAFVALNCSALNEDLFESELFGHERGAFTGAVSAHHGRFERADDGTLFLDEIGDMPLTAQAKLLRVLEHGTFERVGGEVELQSDVRIVAATNVPLEREVRRKTFRSDLYHRVAVLRIHAPPLRERRDDIPLLVDHFLQMFNDRYGRAIRRLSPEAMHALEDYDWPGNVRELRNVVERLYVESRSDVIGRGALLEWEREREVLAAGSWNLDLRDQQRLDDRRTIVTGAPEDPIGEDEIVAAARLLARALEQRRAPESLRLPGAGVEAGVVGGLERGLAADGPIRHVSAEVRGASEPEASKASDPPELTEEVIREAFQGAGGNLARAARTLGVHRSTLYRHMDRLGLDRDELAIDD